MRTMSEAEWAELVYALHDYAHDERAIAGARKLQQNATKEDVPRFSIIKGRVVLRTRGSCMATV